MLDSEFNMVRDGPTMFGDTENVVKRGLWVNWEEADPVLPVSK